MSIYFHEEDLPEGALGPGAVAVDTETMCLNPLRDRLCVVQISDGSGDEHLVRFKPGSPYDAPVLKAVLADPNRLKIFHFARFDIAAIQQAIADGQDPTQTLEATAAGPQTTTGSGEPGALATIDYDLQLLANLGVTHLVTLTENDIDVDALLRNGLKNIHLPIFDREAPTLSQAYMLVRRMQQLLDADHVVAVHCRAGIGRTGTVLAAWLIREGGLSATDAIARLRNINPAYVQTEEQEVFLQAFEQDILKRL